MSAVQAVAEASKNQIIPFGIRFAEKKVEFPAFECPFSDKDQIGLWSSEDVNPMHMATTFHTQGGDQVPDDTW